MYTGKRLQRFIILRAYLSSAGCIAVLLGAFACSDGDDGPPGPPGPPGPAGPTSTTLGIDDDPPGIQVEILSVAGGRGPDGAFRVGDDVSITFELKKDDGSSWDIGEMSAAGALVSGPSSNYQRVLPQAQDLAAASLKNADGSYTYRFSDPLPAVYLAPFNDTPSIGPADGEMTGEALQSGTYTAAVYFAWDYTVLGEPFRDAGNAASDFLFGDASAIETRAVVGLDNCNRCHVELRAHEGLFREVSLCVLCHTAGAEDQNLPEVAGGTPGASVDFRVMVHRLHNGKHLPSVRGVSTNPDGTRDYGATPTPYVLVGGSGEARDFSEVGYPVMPSAYVAFTFDTTGTNYTGAFGNGPMPRDIGYAALPLGSKLLEDEVRTGAVSCATCHGDPDGSGPLAGPAQGALHQTNPTRVACGSCHDDVVWGQPYTSSGQTMPAQATNADCRLCHAESGDNLAVADAHLHPYLDPAFNSGVNILLSGVGGGSGPGGAHQAGDGIDAQFSVRNDAGADLPIHSLTRLQMIVTGPTLAQQWLLPNVNVFDFALRKSTPFTGTGTASGLSVNPTALEQTIAVVFTSSTSFDVVGSVSGPLLGQGIGAGQGSMATISYEGVGFTLTQGSTAYAAGDRYYFEVVPVAPSYSVPVPRDIAFERLGVATGAEQVVAFGNTPAYWGRQVVWERTALVGAPTAITEDVPALGRYVACDSSALALSVSDRVVLDAGTAFEEYAQVGRVQTTDDSTGVDLGIRDRVWLTTGTRSAHATGTGTIQEVTLSSRREGLAYTMPTSDAEGITLLAGQFAAGNPVVASYRTRGRFGYRDAPGGPLREIYPPVATGDSDDIEASWGDWKGLPLVSGTYELAMWANRDFSVSPSGAQVPTEAFNNLASDNTTYRMMAPPATFDFLYGSATVLEPRAVISSGDDCNRCHGDLAAHGFGRRGLETCLACHSTSGIEDGPKYTFPTWYIGPTPGVTMDFRTLLHKIHRGKDLAHAEDYTVIGVFLGTPYPVQYAEVGFPVMPGGTGNCEICHGEDNPAWKMPADRDHPTEFTAPVREWRAVCGACHDSEAGQAHIEAQTTTGGEESCALCHGEGSEWNVERVHKPR